jgi:TPR repeat protein
MSKVLRSVVSAFQALNLRKPLRHPLTRIRDAAEDGEAEAQYQIGESYLAGWFVPRQPVVGERWLVLAAKQGHAKAQHSLSLLYMSGSRAQGDAASWLNEAQGDLTARANAELLFPEGLDIAPDSEKAFRFAQSAAEQGLGCAQANLGMFYLRGIGTGQNFAKALEWCGRAAQQHEAVGALGLGVMHEHGFGTPRDPKEAARWYALAADLGNDAAATALGLLHLDGLGVEQDIAKARRLLAGPASRGNELAKKGLAELYAIMEAETGQGPDQSGVKESAIRHAI